MEPLTDSYCNFGVIIGANGNINGATGVRQKWSCTVIPPYLKLKVILGPLCSLKFLEDVGCIKSGPRMMAHGLSPHLSWGKVEQNNAYL